MSPKAWVGLAILVTLIAISIYMGSFLPGGTTPDHRYGEPVGRVVEPSLNECVLNGHYYPISSGKCTFNASDADSHLIVAGGGSGAVENYTPLPECDNRPIVDGKVNLCEACEGTINNQTVIFSPGYIRYPEACWVNASDYNALVIP